MSEKLFEEGAKSGLSEQKIKQIKSDLEQSSEIKNSDRPASDIYSGVENKDPETGVEKPTLEAVEEAKEWVDEANQR